MRTRFVEATQSVEDGFNWGKFMIGVFEPEEWKRPSEMAARTPRSSSPADVYAARYLASPSVSLLRSQGWSEGIVLVVDLATGEGAMFSPGGLPSADLDKHRVWVCPMFEPFLAWLYKHVATPEPRHEISEIDAELRTAVCSVCGTTRVRLKGEGAAGHGWRCVSSPSGRKATSTPWWFDQLPAFVEIPGVPGSFTGYRREGPRVEEETLALARRVVRSDENMPTERGVPLGWVDGSALQLARAIIEIAGQPGD